MFHWKCFVLQALTTKNQKKEEKMTNSKDCVSILQNLQPSPLLEEEKRALFIVTTKKDREKAWVTYSGRR